MTVPRMALPGAEFAALPPECPLPMPRQCLFESCGRAAKPETAPRGIALRRLTIFATSLALSAGAAYEMYQVLVVGGLTVLEIVILALFTVLFAWIALSFISCTAGFFLQLAGPAPSLGIDATAPRPAISARTAVLLPTYNEDPKRVMSRLHAIWESVQATGHEALFDFFILSDSTDPEAWIAEEAEFMKLRDKTASHRIYYRHRTNNIERKAGNIAEWIRRFGGQYEFMIVLDADSLMEGDTIVRLVAAMEQNPTAGLIQTLPVLVNGETLFARLQQFAGRVYGPLIARGIAWWHGSESNYWGHNAIIRIRAFAEQSGLPILRGRKPFGGHIMSHDFVEAALLRRAGWGVHLAIDLGGSYEECPPSVTEYALRDRRWCQGNLQHIAVLPARGLHWVSRLHLLVGIGCYVTAPLWLLFLSVGILISLQAQFIRPDYFPTGATLFPQWPAQDPIRAAWVFAGTMAMLILPKLFGYITMLLDADKYAGIGGAFRGFVSVILETIISALIAPIMMVMQSKAVSEIILGRDGGWSAQQRDGGDVDVAELIKRYAVTTLLGIALGLGAYAVSAPLLYWMSPVVAGLVLTIPVVWLTSLMSAGAGLRWAGLLLTPEEHSPPTILLRANQLHAETRHEQGGDPVGRLAASPDLLEAHLQMLSVPTRRRRGEINADLVLAVAKLDTIDTRQDAVEVLSRKELFALLGDPRGLRKLLSKPDAACHRVE